MPLALLNFGTRAMMSPHDCGGCGADLVEHLLVPEQHDRRHGLDRHRVELAVDRRRPERGREDAVSLISGFCAKKAGHVVDLARVDVALQAAAAPAPDQGRALAGADGGLDLLLVGVVGEQRLVDRRLRVRLVEPRDRVLADVLLRLAGQRPVRRDALAASAAATGAGLARRSAAGRQRDARPGRRCPTSRRKLRRDVFIGSIFASTSTTTSQDVASFPKLLSRVSVSGPTIAWRLGRAAACVKGHTPVVI